MGRRARLTHDSGNHQPARRGALIIPANAGEHGGQAVCYTTSHDAITDYATAVRRALGAIGACSMGSVQCRLLHVIPKLSF
ncbi:hypothetical protein GGD56_006861 [Rhizobium mongolense]|uniref:Uncharacterized protein n=1 Tax=Rhizobium mongolense TaxID=57676 RepID=A0ABR6IYG7_9HYPH|nr:hypothetical protein [Rhizobium mongolense]